MKKDFSWDVIWGNKKRSTWYGNSIKGGTGMNKLEEEEYTGNIL